MIMPICCVVYLYFSCFFSSDYAFLCVEEYFRAMRVCLQAVEQNRVTLLAELDVSLVSLNLELKQ